MNTTDSIPALDCLLVADDLTGACDAAVHFAMRGRRTMVPVTPGAAFPEASVLGINTGTRGLEPAAVREAISAVAANLADTSPRILFKKIDSTLRGHAGVEIAAALTAFGCDAAIVCPAFPRMNRIVRSGCLSIAGEPEFRPIEVAGYLRAQGVERCTQTSTAAMGEAILSGARVVVLDAVCDDDLDRIAAAGLALNLRILWAGSAGLASALARCGVDDRVLSSARPPIINAPILFCIGSDHPVTLRQQTALVDQQRALLLHWELATTGCISAALRHGQHVVLRIPHGQATSDRLNDLLAGASASALVLSGGDTAALFCRAAGAQRIDLFEEVIPGVPWGVIHGGQFDGTPVVTKSGGFGDPDALIQVADYFACQNQ